MPEQEQPALDVGSIKAPEKLPVDLALRKVSKQERAFYAVQMKGYEQELGERKKYAFRIFVLCCLWITAVLALLVAQGFAAFTHFSLPIGVLLAAIGSTTANIIAVFVIVARHLFPNRNR